MKALAFGLIVNVSESGNDARPNVWRSEKTKLANVDEAYRQDRLDAGGCPLNIETERKAPSSKLPLVVR